MIDPVMRVQRRALSKWYAELADEGPGWVKDPAPGEHPHLESDPVESWFLSGQPPLAVSLEPGVIVPLNVPAVENVSTVERMRRDPGHWAYEEPVAGEFIGNRPEAREWSRRAFAPSCSCGARMLPPETHLPTCERAKATQTLDGEPIA